MANNDRTSKELATPNVAYQPLCIQYPYLDVGFELKSGLIHLLRKFLSLAIEDLHNHKLCASCPPHYISNQLLIQYFYEVLSPMDWSLANAARGGALVDNTLATVRYWIANMAENFQQFGSKMITGTRGVREISCTDHQRTEHRLDELTLLVRQLAMGQHIDSTPEPARVCGICACPSHPTDACPQL